MPGERWNRSPEEWQELILRCLKIRYPVGEFVEVPDTVRGDCGIEGFTRDGTAFQCYAADEPLTAAELTKKQKAKVTKDIGKLRKNAAILQSILGTTQLRRWVLVVPRWQDKDLQAHAERKAEEIRRAGVPFVAPDFAPAIVTSDDFAVERGKLVAAGVGSLRLAAADIADNQQQDWVEAHDALVGNLDRKALVICNGSHGEARRLRDRFIRHHLEGRNALDTLRERYPDLYEEAFRVKEDRERFLETESLIPDALPPQKLRETIDRLRSELNATLPGLSSFTVDELVHEAVADWLLRCPLDFPRGTTSNGHTSPAA